MTEAITISDLRDRARSYLPRALFDWIEGGAGDELTLRENEAVFSRYRFRPRYLRDVSGRSQKKTLFGRVWDSPFGIAPTGYAGLFRPNADLSLARAAHRRNIPYIMSGSSVASMEEAAEAVAGNLWYQLYGATDETITRDLIRRADAAGCEALVITVDIPVAARRERDLRNGFGFPLRITPRMVMDGLCHPAWSLRYLLSGGLPAMANWAPYAPNGSSALQIADFSNEHSYCVQTWDHLRLFRDLWPRRLVVKGIVHPEDARSAVAAGADGLIISNHGGRQFDRAELAPLLLGPLREAVGPDVPLMMDGGIRRGSDILTALCLGADFVFCGRAMLYGVVADGELGVGRAIDILQTELSTLMGQIGCLSPETAETSFFLVETNPR